MKTEDGKCHKAASRKKVRSVGRDSFEGVFKSHEKKKGGHTQKKRTSLLHGFKDYDVDVSAHIFFYKQIHL